MIGVIAQVDLTVPEFLLQAVPTAGGLGVAVYGFLVLLKRGDAQQAKNIQTLIEQRDREERRADTADERAAECQAELARVLSQQRAIRHRLKGQVQRYWTLSVVWRQVALNHGAPDTGEIPDVEDV